MKNYYLILLSVFILSCNNERVLLLPEVEQAEVTEVLDVSPAYIFYDETQPDSVLLNRKNLISTTNWLVNVDKRLTLKQAIPHIKFLQDKKRDAKMHKNENAKNYFTCNDKSIGDLGFIEFTDINYFFEEIGALDNNNLCLMNVNNLNDVSFSSSVDLNIKFTENNFSSAISILEKEFGKSFTIVMILNETMSFQDYITLKSKLVSFQNSISDNEFIF